MNYIDINVNEIQVGDEYSIPIANYEWRVMSEGQVSFIKEDLDKGSRFYEKWAEFRRIVPPKKKIG